MRPVEGRRYPDRGRCTRAALGAYRCRGIMFFVHVDSISWTVQIHCNITLYNI